MAGKRIENAYKTIDKSKLYSLKDAVKLVKENANAKFDETVDLAINLGVDPKYADQMVRGGADIVGAENLIDSILAGKIEFDRCIATPDMMGLAGRVARVLGPKGLMPNPKLGTVTMDVAGAVKKAKAGEVQYRAEKTGIVHAGVGKVSFSEEAIYENAKALIDAVIKAKPSGAKGTYLKKISISSTMGAGVHVDLANL